MKSAGIKNFRTINREAVLSRLRETEAAGAAELAAMTRLSVATCASIAAELVAEGLAVELAERESSGGRPARRYAFNPDRLLAAGLAADPARGGARLAYSIANALGTVIETGEEKVSRAGPEAVDGVLEALRGKHPALRGVAVSVPGVIRDGVIGICDLPELSGLALERHVNGKHGLACVVDNDVNFAALGYCRTLAAPGTAGLVFMNFPLGNCAGAGVIVNGALVRGKSNFAGEISFIPLSSGPREGQVRIHADPARLGKFIARITASVTAVLNPEIVALSGSAVRAEMLPDIRRQCLALLPAEHLPELDFCAGYDGCRFAGMAAAALDALQGDAS